MKEPVWLNAADIYGIHKQVTAITGGKPGILDVGMIASSLTKAKNVFHYTANPNIFELAAVYGYGFTKNHCFLEGNVQVAFITVYTFLMINGYKLTAMNNEVVERFSTLAASNQDQSTDIENLAQWLCEHTQANTL